MYKTNDISKAKWLRATNNDIALWCAIEKRQIYCYYNIGKLSIW